MLRAGALLLALAAGPAIAAQPQTPGDAVRRSLACNGIVPPVEFRDLVAQSSLILTGIADAPPAASSNGDGHRSLHVRVTAVLKGDLAPGEIDIGYYEGPGGTTPATRNMAALTGRPALFHLVRVDGSHAGFYFVHDEEALRPASPANLNGVGQEVARQRNILAHWQPDPAWPNLDEVARLLSSLASLEPGGRFTRMTQERIFVELEALGPEGVLAMIALMDDRRPLAIREISLENHFPGAFEDVRHYGPQVIADALAAILNQVAHEDFGFIYNGGSERERVETINGWRVYAADLACGRR
jgi:hypothetical protein